MNNSNDRIFPRYETSQLKVEIIFPIIEHATYYLENASLSGIQIYGNSKIITNDFNQIHVKLSAKEIFTTNAYQVWHEDINPETSNSMEFRSGMRLKFIDSAHYEKWLKFITALHVVNLKKS